MVTIDEFLDPLCLTHRKEICFLKLVFNILAEFHAKALCVSMFHCS